MNVVFLSQNEKNIIVHLIKTKKNEFTTQQKCDNIDEK